MKRQRGRGRKPGGGGHYNNNPNNNYQHNQPNRTMESSGPEVKVRGPASHIHERYLQLARDATAAGDRVLGENYLQHADHYFRLLRAMQPVAPPPQQQAERFGGDQDFADEGGPENETGGDAVQVGGGDDQQEGQAPQGQQDRDADFRRGRGRRSRFRPVGEGAEAGERPDQRAEQPEQRPDQRRERPPREERAPREPEGPEGFSNGPKPAFLRND